MTAVKDDGPLNWSIPIVDKNGNPTPEFLRKWKTQRDNNALIGTVSFGSGAPTGSPADGAEYVDNSVTPAVLYIGVGGSWIQVGPKEFTELQDTPDDYVGKAHDLVRVDAAEDALEFVAPGSLSANPTATASDTAVNGTAATFMRSDAAPAVQKATTSVFGLVKPDGTTITASGGVISASGGGGGTPANPTATAGPTAINGAATTYMRSDAAPAVQLATTGQFGLVKPDGTTITISSGVISSAGGGGGGGGTTPTIRNTSSATTHAISVTVGFPSGTAVGDLVIIFLEQGYPTTGVPTGWTSLYTFANWVNQDVIAKVMTSSDISAGSVTQNYAGFYDGVYYCVVITGSTVNQLYKIDSFTSAGGSSISSQAVTGMNNLPTYALMLGFGCARGSMTITASSGLTSLGTLTNSDASGILFTCTPSLFGINETLTYPSSNSGAGWNLIGLGKS